MNWLKKFWIVFASFLPFSAGAFLPLAIGGGVLITGLVGASVYRSVSPVNLSDALSFFSACWSCQLFSDIVAQMSYIIPKTYHALGVVIIPFSVALMAVWMAWEVVKVYIMPGDGQMDGWSIGGKFGVHMIKVAVISALLLIPLPRLISTTVIEPVFSIGLSMNYSINVTDIRQNYANCIVATAIADSDSINADAQKNSINAFSPRFRHNLTCQIANVHQMTGLGMMIGWTMLSAAFDYDHMHKILWKVPIFPNIPLLCTGLLLLALYIAALLPIPLYFLEIFVRLAMDFIFLPLTLLAWVFQGWKVFPSGKGNIQQTVNDVISGVLGLALTGLFITFSIMLLNSMFGEWNGMSMLQAAINKNDSQMLIDGLMSTTGNTPLVTIILMGIFMTMFMCMIPALIKTMFNVNISDKYYKTMKKDIGIVWSGVKKWWKSGEK